MTRAPDFDVVIVGAGFAGLYALKKLRDLGFRVRVLEAGGGVGGTWYFNRYPGARCDVESVQYSYQFSSELQQEWTWSERYATQPEILSYINHVAERFDLLRDIRLNTRVVAARYDNSQNVWEVETHGGDRISAHHFVLAVGCLSSANKPEIKGAETFRGQTYHTGEWPHHGVNFSGQRVGVIGTGSSAIQSIPRIAEHAAHLTVFQRTPNFSVPAHNRPVSPADTAQIKAHYDDLRADAFQRPFAITFGDAASERMATQVSAVERDADFEYRWQRGGLGFLGGFVDLMADPVANGYAAEFVHRKIRAIVNDPVTAEKLCPKQLIGVKRICVDTDYFETFNRSNVSLVDLQSEPISEIVPNGLKTTALSYPLDAIVYATGFDAMTGAFLKMTIQGCDGTTLRDAWAQGPQTYLGLGVAGFPNMFILQGPGSPSVLTNMIVSTEFHVNWLATCLEHLRAHHISRMEANVDAQSGWIKHVNEVAHMTLYPQGNSWYLGANMTGKPRVFMPYLGFPTYVAKCQSVARNGYEGFTLSK